ncbi:hypothetical protein FNQ90_14610 [Streptomyces alkaliphilus]|uniref:Uncharacterized protein n=1 Tax=Streptomyces alkaliphilus TaxID=1472722 RepID=A0A7W3TEQ4_9ACTN|nr:hypothetical protein [Streptomyces alkaliphilus]MBB0245300.1 hypothetical protein [Streptomyces alkaliphilus]
MLAFSMTKAVRRQDALVRLPGAPRPFGATRVSSAPVDPSACGRKSASGALGFVDPAVMAAEAVPSGAYVPAAARIRGLEAAGFRATTRFNQHVIRMWALRGLDPGKDPT